MSILLETQQYIKTEYINFKALKEKEKWVHLLSLVECSSGMESEVKVTQSCLTFCDPMGCVVPGSLQAKILAWVAFPFSGGSSQPRDQTLVSRIAGRFFTSWATKEAQMGSPIDVVGVQENCFLWRSACQSKVWPISPVLHSPLRTCTRQWSCSHWSENWT